VSELSFFYSLPKTSISSGHGPSESQTVITPGNLFNLKFSPERKEQKGPGIDQTKLEDHFNETM
jgi:hypothetical protein